MKIKSRTIKKIAVWTLLSLALQLGGYAALNYSVHQVMHPAAQDGKPITTRLRASLPDADAVNVQLSYAKDYLAYRSGGVFKVYSLKQQKVVFEKAAESEGGQNLGVLNYQWLPDRNSLIYFYAKISTSSVTVTEEAPSPGSQVAYEGENGPAYNEEDGSVPLPETKTVEKSTQITELNTLELPNGGEANNRHNLNLNSFPAGGEILQIASSTYTNLIYITVKTGKTVKLMEIDVNKNTKFLQQSGETILNLAASDRYGTLYLERKSGKAKQIVAVFNGKRLTVSEDGNHVLLGARDGVLYVGTVKGDRLIQILSGEESADHSAVPTLTPIWEGDVPYDGERIVVGFEGQVILYDDAGAHSIQDGKLATAEFEAGENFISPDGAERMQLTHADGVLQVSLEPFRPTK
jgi:predicted heme/steroid binding protein